MKKFLLLTLVIGFAMSVVAQGQLEIKKYDLRSADTELVTPGTTSQTPDLDLPEAISGDVTVIPIGKAAHQRGVRREDAVIISYDVDMDVIAVTNILDPETYGSVNDVGVVGQWYSMDRGLTWSEPVIINADLSQGPNYYVAGACYNPDGNTSVDNMFGVYQGTIYPTTGDWRFKAFGSSTYAGDFYTTYLYEEAEYDGYWNQFGIGQVMDEMRCMHLKTYGTWSSFTQIEMMPITGEFDGEVFDWDFSNLVDAEFYIGADDVVEWAGMYVGHDAGAEIAWSNDGQIGYMWMLGVSDNDPSSYQPMVWKTNDAGDSWDYIFLDFLDGDIQDILEPYIIECTSGDMIPHFNESAGAVDGNGDLQIFANVGSASADVITYPDSIGYHWVYPGDLFNISVDDDGIKDVVWIDSLNTLNVEQDAAEAYCGSAGWQHRLFVAKSPDEMQLFFTWGDTRDIATYESNAAPDLFGWTRAYDEPDNYYAETVCFTEDSPLTEKFWFTNGAAKAYYDDETGMYTVPYMQAITPPEFYGNTVPSTDPITLSYVTGITFDVLYVGVEENATSSAFEVAQNIPNPFTGSTMIEVTTGKNTKVTVEVTNLMGQKVYTVDAMVNGTQQIEVTSDQLEAGIYLYTVKAGNNTVTKRMIVE